MNTKETNINIIKDFTNYEQFDFNSINIIKNVSLLDIKIKENTNLTIVELFDEQIENIDLKREFSVGKNSTLSYLKLSTIDTNIKYNVSAKDETNINIHLFDLDKNNINKLTAKLENKDVDLKVNTLVNLKNDATAFNSFNITHIHPNTYSDIKIRHLLDDSSKAEFEATTVIENKALYSKGFQDSKTILLSDDASIKARPHLEILTDELEASHGATTGGLDIDALYYLQSRGLKKEQATKILIEAFANVSVENIKDKTLQEWISEQIRRYHV